MYDDVIICRKSSLAAGQRILTAMYLRDTKTYSLMKRFFTFFAMLSICLGFAGCMKEANDEHLPVICYFEQYVPVRVLNASGDDLLSPAKLQGGTFNIRWGFPGRDTMAYTKMTPGTYVTSGQADQHYFTVPLTHADKGLTVHFSLNAGETETLFIRTSADTTRPYGVTEVIFNGKKVAPVMLFGTSAYGLELVK